MLHSPATSRPTASAWQQLVRLHAEPGYAFLDAAWRALAAEPGHAELRVLMIDHLARLGLGEPARELLPDRTAGGPDGVDPDELRSALADVPSGRLPWSELAAVFEANLEVLRARHGDRCPDERRLRAARADHAIYRTLAGHQHLARREPGGALAWVPALTEPIALDETHLPVRPDSAPAMLIGLALHDVAERAAALTRRVHDDRSPLYLLEPDESRLAAWLHAGDRRELLAEDRVYLCAGTDAVARYAALLDAEDDLPPAGLYCALPGARLDWRQVDAVRTAVETRRRAKGAAVADRLAARARSRPPASRASGIGPGGRVLGFTSRATTMLQYSMRDIGRALTDLGLDFEVASEAAPHRITTGLTVGAVVERVDPDLIVLVNHFRHERPQAFGDAPILTWIQDPTELVLSAETGAALGPLDFVCGYYRNRCVGELGYPAERFFPAPLPVCHHVFHDGPVPPAELGPLRCDLLYVGHLHETVEEHHARWRTQVAAPLHRLLDRLDDEVDARLAAADHQPFWRPVVDEHAAACGLSIDPRGLEALANLYTARRYDLRWRRQTLHWAARYAVETGRTLRVHGRGWDRDPRIAPFACGPIEHGEPLRRACRAASLVVQTVPGGYLHQRTFEGLASGALVVGRRSNTSDAPKHFPDLGEVQFDDEPSFRALADRLLDDDARRDELAAGFRAVVLDRFTYLAVLRRVLAGVRRVLEGASS